MVSSEQFARFPPETKDQRLPSVLLKANFHFILFAFAPFISRPNKGFVSKESPAVVHLRLILLHRENRQY